MYVKVVNDQSYKGYLSIMVAWTHAGVIDMPGRAEVSDCCRVHVHAEAP